jgi:hypothetical protein
VRGETAAWGVVMPIGTLTVALLGVLVWVLSTIRDDERPTAALNMEDPIP